MYCIYWGFTSRCKPRYNTQEPKSFLESQFSWQMKPKITCTRIMGREAYGEEKERFMVQSFTCQTLWTRACMTAKWSRWLLFVTDVAGWILKCIDVGCTVFVKQRSVTSNLNNQSTNPSLILKTKKGAVCTDHRKNEKIRLCVLVTAHIPGNRKENKNFNEIIILPFLIPLMWAVPAGFVIHQPTVPITSSGKGVESYWESQFCFNMPF